MEKLATVGIGKYCMSGCGWIWFQRVKLIVRIPV